jgi:hypothetical protein
VPSPPPPDPARSTLSTGRRVAPRLGLTASFRGRSLQSDIPMVTVRGVGYRFSA